MLNFLRLRDDSVIHFLLQDLQSSMDYPDHLEELKSILVKVQSTCLFVYPKSDAILLEFVSVWSSNSRTFEYRADDIQFKSDSSQLAARLTSPRSKERIRRCSSSKNMKRSLDLFDIDLAQMYEVLRKEIFLAHC